MKDYHSPCEEKKLVTDGYSNLYFTQEKRVSLEALLKVH